MEQISIELETIIDNIVANVVDSNDSTMTDEKFVQSVLSASGCAVFQFLNKKLLSADIQKITKYFNDIDVEPAQLSVVEYFDDKVKVCSGKEKKVTSLSIFANILETNQKIGSFFKEYGINRLSVMEENVKLITNRPLGSVKKRPVNNIVQATNKVLNNKPSMVSNRDFIEKQLVNICDSIDEHNPPYFYGNENAIASLWESCVTKNNRTVVVKGGFGLDNFIKYLAYLLEKGDVPYQLKDKKLYKMDLISLISDVSLKGMFESKFRKIIEELLNKGKYIIVLDNSQNVIDDETYKDYHFSTMVDELISQEKIPLILLGKPCKSLLKRTYKVLDIDHYKVGEMYKAINRVVTQLETYHNVKIEEDLLVKLFNKVGKDTKLFAQLSQLLDNIAAFKVNGNTDFCELGTLKEKIDDIDRQIDEIMDKSQDADEDILDELTQQKMQVITKLKKKEKDLTTKKKIINITCGDMIDYLKHKIDDECEEISAIYTIWYDYLNITNGKKVELISDEPNVRLKNLDKDVNDIVIGQEEAVEQICQVVKKQQLGFNLDKPSVVLCAGNTGVGKTYLCKTIAKLVFGDENHFVRLDMSEYAEKNSVTKLYGTSAGYVGYENGGVLTEAIKKAKRGVLLLDEIEKAHNEVFDAFLQVFDEGRLTDNHGETVSFKDFIIVMTSNIGAAESMRNQGGVGFKKQDVDEYKKEVVEKAMKNKFKPEFLNRVDKIIHFKMLGENELKSIIRLELDKLVNNIKVIGYLVGDNAYDDDLVEYLYELVKDDREYGARPIIRVIKNEVENKLIQKIIDENLDKGHTFDKIWQKD